VTDTTGAEAAPDAADLGPSVPPVVAVVVTHDPGPWLEESLAAVGAQDYPNLSVLVLASGSTDDTMGRVAQVLPSAYVRRLEGDPGFGPAANDVLQIVEGASFYAFCHDDVILDTVAVRALVEEAFRSNAGIVGPKLVDWDDPAFIREFGEAMTPFGASVPLVENELDQAQHDRLSDVLAVSSAGMLVRQALWERLEGFDDGKHAVVTHFGFCARARLAVLFDEQRKGELIEATLTFMFGNVDVSGSQTCRTHFDLHADADRHYDDDVFKSRFMTFRGIGRA